MEQNNKSSWQVRLAAVIIFVLGFTAGALALNVYRGWARGGAQENRQDHFQKMVERLELNDQQKTQVEQILNDTRGQLEAVRKESEPRLADIRKQADERLQKVLTPEQWQKFQQMQTEMRSSRRHGRGRRDDDSPPPANP